ncbi:MAG: glycosyltransferase [Candidatus Omnitrophica bacterium]|nr:glycosyltransferase [Candidatus Omnitrophota bacterium]
MLNHKKNNLDSGKQKNILFLASSLNGGGAEGKLVDLILGLNRKKFKPFVCCIKEKGVLYAKLKETDVKVYSDLISFKYDFRALFRIISIIRKDKIDVVFTLDHNNAMFWGRLAAKLCGVSVVIAIIYSTRRWPNSRSIWPINKVLTPITDRIIAVSNMQRDYIINEEKVPADKISVSYDGVDLEKFSGNFDSAAVKMSLGINNGSSVVGIVAGLRPEKGHITFLKAAKKILAAKPDTCFLIIGDGPQRRKLVELTRALGIEEKVKFLGWVSDVPKLVSIFDVAVLSSYPYVETFPNAVLEYMAQSKPVVATNVGSMPEMIKNGFSGFLVTPYDEDSLAEKISFLLNDEGFSLSLGQRARESVERFSLKRMVEEREELITNLIKSKDESFNG